MKQASSSSIGGVPTDNLKVLAVLYLTYACYYLPRKADSVVKSSLVEESDFSVGDIALGDTLFLLTYTVCLMNVGTVGSMVPSQGILAIGLSGTALVSVLKARSSSPTEYVALQIAHGVFQSTGWPTCIKLLATWIPYSVRGFGMGVWTTCQSIGGFAGAVLATKFAESYGSWRFAYLYHVPLLLACSLLVLLFVRESPSHADSSKVAAAAETVAPSSSSSTKSVTMWQVVKLKGVPSLGCSYFFLKFLRYALLFWLPFYYRDGLNFSETTSGYLSTTFEMGGVIGTPLIGYVSDAVFDKRRDLTCAVFMSLSAAFLTLSLLVQRLGVSMNGLSMVAVGVFVIGPDSILSGTIAQDIGNNSGLGSEAVSAVAGFMNAVGSTGAVFQSSVTAYVSQTHGWGALFIIFVLCALVSSKILFKVASAPEWSARFWTLAMLCLGGVAFSRYQ